MDAFALWEIAINHVPEFAVDAVCRMNQSFLSFFVIPWPAFLNGLRSIETEEGDAVMTLLTKEFNVITDFLNNIDWKLLVVYFRFL